MDISPQSDAQVLAALRRGDELAFTELVNKYHASMVRVALMYVSSQVIAEEVVQEAWIGVLKGLSRFEGRSSLKTWIYSILINRAKTHAQREGRYVQLSLDDDGEEGEPTVSQDRFNPPDHPLYANHWVTEPDDWNALPERRLLSRETLRRIQDAIEALPPNQKTVITLRDIDQLSSEEVCNILDISETNQRVLLHRARAKVRDALEQYLRQ
ncbi:MAG: sigma-70 family RNA polymerase sigma factor [Anaerolineae bacterium]